jgi:hypothetical protein
LLLPGLIVGLQCIATDFGTVFTPLSTAEAIKWTVLAISDVLLPAFNVKAHTH